MAKEKNIANKSATGKGGQKEKNAGTGKGLKKSHNLDERDPSYLWSMSLAPKIDESTHWFQLLPIAFFTAFVILITRMHSYERAMGQFFWSDGETNLSDFFSYFKAVAIIVCASLALVLILYRIFCQALCVKKSFAYIPMIVYTVFVLLSYACSDYKDIAWMGWNDRFEGTLVLLAYMVMLFFIINSINSERDVKWIVYPLAISSTLLSILGITQAMDKDFFRTVIGQKLLVPNKMTQDGATTWDLIEKTAKTINPDTGKPNQFLEFTFQNKEIYQTVFNINYVSFYLTLLIPLFAMLFIKSVVKGKEYPIWQKIMWGVLFALTVFNLIGSSSSGGLLGMAVVCVVGVIILNKRILKWWKPVVILLVLTLIVAGTTYQRWVPEFFGAINGVIGKQVLIMDEKGPRIAEGSKENAKSSDSAAKTDLKSENADKNNVETPKKLDFIETNKNTITLSMNGEELSFKTFLDDPMALSVKDKGGKKLSLVPTNVSPIYKVDDERFATITVRSAQDEQGGNYIVIGTNGDEWPFKLTEDGAKYLTGVGKLVDMRKVEAIGFKNNQEFGSGRGYIWSRSIPMMKETLILGHGADTYCVYFPHDDYVGKYNSGTFSTNTNIVVDKPHNMYMGMIIGTGGISMLALLALWGMYIVQSFRIYFRKEYDSFNSFVGVGIFLGICGFLVAGLVNDSTVSVMPLFYGLLGTGIAINLMLKREPKGIKVDLENQKITE